MSVATCKSWLVCLCVVASLLGFLPSGSLGARIGSMEPCGSPLEFKGSRYKRAAGVDGSPMGFQWVVGNVGRNGTFQLDRNRLVRVLRTCLNAWQRQPGIVSAQLDSVSERVLSDGMVEPGSVKVELVDSKALSMLGRDFENRNVSNLGLFVPHTPKQTAGVYDGGTVFLATSAEAVLTSTGQLVPCVTVEHGTPISSRQMDEIQIDGRTLPTARRSDPVVQCCIGPLLLHEVGHALGLGHVTAPSSAVMYRETRLGMDHYDRELPLPCERDFLLALLGPAKSQPPR